MNQPYEMLSVAYIRKWLAGIIVPNARNVARPTIRSVAKETGIPSNTLEWLARKDTACISPARQRLLSKTIAEIENGQLVFEPIGPRRIARRVENPKPRVRYGFTIGAAGPKLVAIDRPKAFLPMPAFRDIFKRS